MNRHILSLVFFIALTYHFTHADRDGFNMYKDYLRGKNDELTDDMSIRDDGVSQKYLYFYRAAPNLVIPALGDLLQTSELINKKSLLFGKRSTVNQFKNYMLTREPPEMQFAYDIVAAADVYKGLLDSVRPIPVRSSLAKRDVSQQGEVSDKRAIFSWAVSSPDPHVRADLSDYYKMTTPRSTVSLVDRLNNKHN